MNRQERTGFRRGGWAVAAALVLALGLVCSSVFVSAQSSNVINGFLGSRAIEIDDLDNNPFTVPDANMVVGDDAANPNYPAVAGATYIDWNTLEPEENNYALIDGSGNNDDSFGGTSTRSCLQPGKAAPQKEDILRAYLANNEQYLYFGLVDKSPNGDSRHVIIFHKNAITTGASCAGNGTLQYLDLTPDDRMILVIFKPSATEPAARVFQVVDNPGSMLLDDAANFTDGNTWQVTGAVAENFAVNTADIASDLLGGDVPVIAETFGEGAVSLAALGITPCGGMYNVSVITRSSGSGGGEAKDFIGGVYSFGGIELTASLTPSCDEKFDYSANATYAGENIDASYAWSCNDGALLWSGKSGTRYPGPGAYTCSVVATKTGTSCTAEKKDLKVNVYAPLSVTADLTGSCNAGEAGSDASYSATKAGGSPSVSYDWTFTKSPAGCVVDPTSSTTASGNLDVTPPTGRGPCTVTGSVTATDLRTDLPAKSCTDDDSDDAIVYAPIRVNIAPDATALACTIPSTPDYSNTGIAPVTFTAVATGGDGTYSYAWTRTGPNEAGACASTATSCAVDIPDSNYCALTRIYVGVDDGTLDCALQNSETEDVTKQTSLSASNK